MHPKEDVFSSKESTEMLQYIVANMITKQEVERIITEIQSDIRASEQRMMDHTSRECGKIRGDLTVSLRREDEKVDEHIRASERAGAINNTESKRLQQLGPFPKMFV